MLHLNSLNYNYSKLKSSEKSLNYLKEISQKFEKYCEEFFNDRFDNPKNNNIDFVIINELKKSFIRSLICFDETSIKFCESIINDFKLNRKKNIFLETENPNLMIHLPNDNIEEGTFHYDQIETKETITIWTPITEYKYNALAYYNFGTILYKFFKILKILKFFPIKYININKFNSLKWAGYFVHKGCLNKSENISSAIVVSLRLGTKDKKNFVYQNFDNENIKYNYESILGLINKLIFLCKGKNYTIQQERKIINDLLKEINFSVKNEIIAKILSIVAQRLYTKLNNVEFKEIAKLIDISVYYLDKNNYSSLSRLKKLNFFE